MNDEKNRTNTLNNQKHYRKYQWGKHSEKVANPFKF